MPPSPNGARVTSFHEQILRTAFAPAERAGAECAALRARSEHLWGMDTRHLLPLLSRALVAAGIDDPIVPRLMQTARLAWLENQLTFERLGTALEVLDAAGVRTMALKGVPLALRHYPDPSLRPMGDFDLLITSAHVPDAIAALQRAEWNVDWELDKDFVARTSEVPCSSRDGQAVLDLHWRLMPWVTRSWSADDPDLWHHATPLAVGERSTLAPADHDLLLHVILHAFRSGWTRVPRWAADVVVMLRGTSGTLDWDRFVDRVLRGHLTLVVAAALTYVASTFDAPVPDAVLNRLRVTPSTSRERHMCRLAQREPASRRHWLFGEGNDLRIGWARASVNYSRIGAITSIPPFLRGRTNVDRLWTLPFVVARRRLRVD
jgi:hypothetical protein